MTPTIGPPPGGALPRISRPFEVTHREVWRITLPMTFAFVTTPLLGVTDAGVIGQLGDPVALGGLAVGSVIFDVAFSSFNFLRSGTTGLTAQAAGEENGREVQAVFWRALMIALTVGIAMILAEPVITALGLLAVAPGPAVAVATGTYVFVRMFSAPFALVNYAVLGHVLGRGQGGLGLALQLLINGVNIALSITFGLVLGWGIAGVALGTVAGETVGALVGAAVVIRRFDPADRPSRVRILDRAGFLRMLGVNRDIMIRSFSLLAAFTLFTRFGAGFGAVVLAANGILMNLFLVGGYFLDGVATAAEQLVGRSVGAHWLPAFDRAVKLAILWSAVLAAAISLVFLLAGDALIALLTVDPGVRDTAEAFLPWAALTPLAGMLAFVMDGVYIGATWSRTMRDMMLVSLALFVLAAFTLTPLFGNHGLWLAMELFLSMRGVSLLLSLPRRRRAAFAPAG
ncbi:MATE family efflux transporter [Mangrovibrevibacter kandeliae]|uniref:MATE family efflux transporter n=1 Tax=Mangrovibrevibacter kandeliae TaxID=2968473 RepID=UPI002117BC28|nr:MATE family efflux transporter [Aurantimonas sp. CSK15Z-1]MCQ8783315.1 MATE family efflux transporter [Aurantimonas sp. CSK15Z-1]